LNEDNVVRIEKLVHGGQGIGTMADGRKVFVWNALPGELVQIRQIKKKRSYVEAIAEVVIEASPDRVEPAEENYLATSPWQILHIEKENQYKADIVRELFDREKIILPEFGSAVQVGKEWNYRNKMEYSFWGDETGLHLALHRRGSHGKQIVTGSKLALSGVDSAALKIVELLNNRGERAGNLKTIIVRSDQKGNVAASLFVKTKVFKPLDLPTGLQGLRVYYSDPKSPASVPTKLLYEQGNVGLQDELLGKLFNYDVDSFFQVNLPVYEAVLQQIKTFITEPEIVDMYAGVGSIGLSVALDLVQLIELDPATVKMAGKNAAAFSGKAEIVEASTEKALEYIVPNKPVIFDPPRAGLHHKVCEQLVAVMPQKIVYLSCNPATQARDLSVLQEVYKIAHFEVFNFFPKTPHIETLAVLTKK
jgi:23S rRNA (uracil1939-C5)-methyltransferase